MNPNIVNDILEELERRQQRRNSFRALRDNSNPFELPEDVFRKIYRLNVDAASGLFQQMLPFWDQGVRVTRTPPVVRFFHGPTLGQDCLSGSSQPNVSRSLHEVVDILVNQLANRFIKFPQTAKEMAGVKEQFFERFHIPGIIGCIDCTHIKIVPPTHMDLGYPPNVFMNRKNFYSLNCQIICDSNCKILAINSRFPGSVHDAAIWRMCTPRRYLHRRYRNGDENTYLLGDSGYPLLPYLLTPIVGAPPNSPAARYTHRHSQIRNCVERTIGQFKGIWRCLSADRVLHYKPNFAARIVYACAIIYNLMKAQNVPMDEDLIILGDNENNVINNAVFINELEEGALLNRGQVIRNRIKNYITYIYCLLLDKSENLTFKSENSENTDDQKGTKEHCSSFKDLGILFDNNISFAEHISNTVSSALKTQGFIIRNCNSFTNLNALKTLSLEIFILIKSLNSIY
ncbi:hypothetical protein NQ315_015505 [Exocentrus adspersus]|uniref:DDE Tnp4 domain-containing protein n=1 Tax=Exocentrus adspersus TaxID=1586481 RepID=A0AAV8VPJ7_9CUCU|nr:hypothetical protein NQ315_015505 [Exocentrus adspersus]